MRAAVAFFLLPGLVVFFVLGLVSFSWTADSSDAATGSAIYARRCASCHQADGGGIAGVFPPLQESTWANMDEEQLIRILLHGLVGKLTVDGVLYDGAMPAMGSTLSDEEIALVLNFMRSSWDTESQNTTADRVAQVRSENLNRTKPWTVEEIVQRHD